MKIHWFQIVANAVLALFLGLICITTYIALSRKPGGTGQDMAKIQQLRYNDTQSRQVALKP